MSTFESLLVHIDPSPQALLRARLARQLAERFGARGTAFYGITPSIMRQPLAIDTTGMAAEVMFQADQDQRQATRSRFEQENEGTGRLRWVDARETAWDIRRAALYADLVIMGQHNPAGTRGDVPAGLVESVILESGRPVLVVPHIWNEAQAGKTVLIAWKESSEAARALGAALPFLKRAGQVHAVSFGSRESTDAALEGLSGYLQAHGVRGSMHHGGQQDGDAGARLLSMAFDLGADLLVMGCYGHSRTREWALGGASRSVLQAMTVPVLMMH